jgi:hypothetical protein
MNAAFHFGDGCGEVFHYTIFLLEQVKGKSQGCLPAYARQP